MSNTGTRWLMAEAHSPDRTKHYNIRDLPIPYDTMINFKVVNMVGKYITLEMLTIEPGKKLRITMPSNQSWAGVYLAIGDTIVMELNTYGQNKRLEYVYHIHTEEPPSTGEKHE